MSAFGSLFSGRYLTSDVTQLPGVWFDVYTGILVLVLVASIFVYIRRRPLSRGLTPRRHFLRNTSQSLQWICGVGLFFCLLRYLEVEYVDFRIYSYLVVLGAILYIGFLTYFLSERYPLQVFNFQQLEAGRRYKPPVRRKPQVAAVASGRSAIQRGKRRR